MHDRPSGPELLRIARDTLLGELSSRLPEERRYAVRMVANAIAIAAREAETAEADHQQALARLAALYGEDVNRAERAPAQFMRLSARLARDIRAGAFDDNAELPPLLLEQACARLRVSNPKYLQAAGLDHE